MIWATARARYRRLVVRPSRRVLSIAAGLVVVLVGAMASVGPVVRTRVGAEAARRRLVVDVGSIRPGWFAIGLRDVHVRALGVDGIDVRLEDVSLELGVVFGLRAVVVHGGAVNVRGSLAEIEAEVREWRGPRDAESGSGRTRLPVRLEGLTLDWRVEGGREPFVIGDGLAFSREDEGLRLGVQSAAVHEGALRVAVRSGEVRVSRSGALASAKAAEVAAIWELARSVESPAEAASAVEPPMAPPAPPPLPVATKRGARSATDRQETFEVQSASPLFTMPDLRAGRRRLEALGTLVKSRVQDGAAVEVEALSLEVRDADAKVMLGPGPLAAVRRGDDLETTFTTRTEAGGTPLAVKAQVPLGAGELVVSLAGGPVPLALLGASEGTVGLVDVARATLGGKGRVVLSAAADTLTFDGEVDARGVAVKQARLAGDVVRGLDVAVRARGMIDDAGELRIDDLEAALGALRLSAHGGIEQKADHYAATFAFALPTAPCASLIESLPSALIPSLRGARMEGLFGAQGRASVDSRKLDELVLVYDVEDHCKMVEVPPPLAKARFTEPFEHSVYLPDGKRTVETTGPGTDGWTDLDHISPFMQVAVLTTEDGAFLHHHGFNHGAIRGAIIANLKARRFVRGASTITMQLAKNLFLTREKTVARKLEELILTDYLEQAFTKEEMMELYLNIIEFGPNVYGVTAAADHYFGRKPAELNLAECLFLASVLPSPSRYHHLFEKGQISDAWLKHVRDLMVIAEKTGKISAGELAEGLSQPIVFHDAKAPAPPPRPPVTSSHFLGDDPPDWQELN
jgi:hypothetical protein